MYKFGLRVFEEGPAALNFKSVPILRSQTIGFHHEEARSSINLKVSGSSKQSSFHFRL